MTGIEWIVDAYGCSPDRLRDLDGLQALFRRMIEDLALHPCGDGRWQQFPVSGGITGLCLLSESHLTCHTFPEHGTLCLNVFCCRPRETWDFPGQLQALMGARTVQVRRIERPYGEAPSTADRRALVSVSDGVDDQPLS